MDRSVWFQLPPVTNVDWAITTLVCFFGASLSIYWLFPDQKRDAALLEKLQAKFGLNAIPSFVFFTATTVWLALLLMLLCGVVLAIADVTRNVLGTRPTSLLVPWGLVDTVRPSILILAGLTATLGAIVALPLTIVRISQNQQQIRNSAELLFNEKLGRALERLGARRQVTIPIQNSGSSETCWEDDVVARATAIDRLAGLAIERPEEVARIASMLTIYVRELSKEYPAQVHERQKYLEELATYFKSWSSLAVQGNAEPPTIAKLPVPSILATLMRHIEWAKGLHPFRSDVEKAVQTLGAVLKVRGAETAKGPDLSHCNLQGFDMSSAQLAPCRLVSTRLEGANLEFASLLYSDLTDASLMHLWSEPNCVMPNFGIPN